MAGQNDVYFVAYDNLNQSAASRHLDLQIDLAPPVTTLSLNNEANPANWPTWFTTPVTVRLHADDGNTGRARSGVSQVRYRLDNGGWQTVGGSDASLVVTTDGSHSVEYYALDNVGNQESSRTVNFQIDQTPPSSLSGVVETHSVVNGQWQRDHNVATFTWNASSDPTSGVWGYQLYFGEDPNGTAYQTFLAAEPHMWTPQPGGPYRQLFRAAVCDVAGNWTPGLGCTTSATMAPHPRILPASLTPLASPTMSGKTSRLSPTPPWPAPHDGVWVSRAIPCTWEITPLNEQQLQPGQQLAPRRRCVLQSACTGYLRLRSRDNVNNEAEDWPNRLCPALGQCASDGQLHDQRRSTHGPIPTLITSTSRLRTPAAACRRCGFRRRCGLDAVGNLRHAAPPDHPGDQPAGWPL
ncbi:hypothetical protein [Candidatus Amarolinea dominans]|uniref:OmpL47-type beta-barrel domain-containing protein n=1 Tax=Candidatus Amarolinea dominans TaxID=3140696 RepID=UPI001E187E68|nr:hypothetical protein [Anaerolineae bacterium]